MKFSELKGEAALDALADLIDPVSELVQNKEIQKLRRENASAKQMAKAMLKTDKKAILQILAIVSGADPETYAPGGIEILMSIIDLLNTPEIKTLFFSPEQTEVNAHSGSAMEDTQAEGQ